MFPGKIQSNADTVRLRFHLRHSGELGLTSWSTIRNDQKPGGSARNCRTHICFDHGERKVYSRGDPRRCPNAAVRYINAIALDLGAREARLQLSSVPPVRRCSQPVQQARFCKQKRPRTYACHPRGAGSQLLGSGDVLRCLHRIDITAHEYDGIKPVLPNGLRLDRKARIANNRAARLREHMQNIWSMASCCCHLIESRKWPSKIKSIVATANEKSNSMRHEVVNRQHLE
ncbi:hypothetical protein SAMN05216466_13018 [Paraburkholderia phenazinium]|uniref:Uncharacterized protein n=1 Tax=Paraburkholderia phenazinium TaxID=60549 RepID=A0A1G8MK77_9BURK|nr:hypothetical protein SAMN05216466_13018 [Paraburkholderia phenazinium]